MMGRREHSVSEWTPFQTALGVCGIAWNQNAISLLMLPEQSVSKLRDRLAASTNQHQQGLNPPNWIGRLIETIARHMSGSAQDFSEVRLDLEGLSEFRKAVYLAAREIPLGQLRTYGELAAAIGRPNASRAVGTALGQNPIALIVPCHRIVGSHNKCGGFSAYGGLSTKEKLLAIEGIRLQERRVLP